MVDVIVNPAPPAPMAAPAASERAQARRETLRLLLRKPAFIIGNVIIIGWIICAVLGQRITPYDPFNDFSLGHQPPSSEHLFGGIIAVEKIFNYNGMGATMLFAAQSKDLPMLTAGVIVIGIVYMLATLTADLLTAWMNPRIRLDASR